MTEGEWLVVMALPLEAQDVFERAGIPVLYTGVGKVNAAMTLTRALAGYRQAGRSVPRVVNFGTAGSRRFATGTIVACTSFHQRDMDVSVLGFAPGNTPYEEIPAVLAIPDAVQPAALRRLRYGRLVRDRRAGGDLRRGRHGSVCAGQGVSCGGHRVCMRQVHQ